MKQNAEEITQIFTEKLLRATGKEPSDFRGRKNSQLYVKIRRYERGESAMSIRGLVDFAGALGYDVGGIILAKRGAIDPDEIEIDVREQGNENG